MATLDDVKADLAAFADDDEDLIIDTSGQILFVRGGREVSCFYEEEPDGRRTITVDNQRMSYRDFVVRYLAQLDVFAERLIAKRSSLGPFVDGPAVLDSLVSETSQGSAVTLLDAECARSSGFSARVCFITADAGHGKTALLRHYQDQCARRFLTGESPFLFWHLDLQGRQLLRLSEALMGDLGDLRVQGLWMPAVIRLLQHRALVLAIDGFDELAAEQGGTDALGALAMLVQQMDGSGTIVAASRRTFFDTEDYLKRSALFRRSLVAACEFNQIALESWGSTEAIQYLTECVDDGNRFDDPAAMYREIVDALGGDVEHPMVTRPFLLTHIARGLLRYQVPARDFVRPIADPMGGVAEVVGAFVEREVATKWRYKDTGEPYLTREQHMRLLSDVAEEMYRAQKDRLDLEIVETLAIILLEEWSVEPSRRQQIIEMVRMHVLLTIPSDGDGRSRSFDHPEFRDYFIAVALKGHLDRVIDGAPFGDLSRYLSTAHLSDSTARYVRRMIDLDGARAQHLIGSLANAVESEVRPTFLHGNVGTLVAAILDGLESEETLLFDAPAIFTGVVLERTRLANVNLSRCVLVNPSFLGARWLDVRFIDCALGDVTLDTSSEFRGVSFDSCAVDGVRVVQGGQEVDREYAPSRIRMLLEKHGISWSDSVDASDETPGVRDPHPDSDLSKLAHRLLRLFNRTTVVTDEIIRIRFRHDHQRVLDELVPLLVDCGVIKAGTWRGRGSQRIWSLQYPIDVVLAAEDDSDIGDLGRFWQLAASG